MHPQAQLSALWIAARSGRPDPGSSSCPVTVISDSAAQVMSVAVNGGPTRIVYARQLGGAWAELPAADQRVQQSTSRDVLVAHVTVDDETLTVHASRAHHALHALQGDPAPGLAVSASIRYELIDEQSLAAVPEFMT